MKLFLKIIAAVVLVIGLAVGSAFYFTAGVVDTAESFLSELGAGRIESARGFLSQGFNETTNEAEFAEFLDGNGLGDYASASWRNRAVNNGVGTLTGDVATRSGGSIPVRMTLVKESGDWKIQAIKTLDMGVASSTSEAPIPNRSEAAALVQQVTRGFAAAVNQADFAAFHQGTHAEFQQQLSAQKLEEIFADFIAQKIDLTTLEKMEPLFTADPAVNGNGILLLKGYYATRPSQVDYEYNFADAGNGWELLGLDIQVNPVSDDD